jgi:hypothetical protein
MTSQPPRMSSRSKMRHRPRRECAEPAIELIPSEVPVGGVVFGHDGVFAQHVLSGEHGIIVVFRHFRRASQAGRHETDQERSLPITADRFRTID